MEKHLGVSCLGSVSALGAASCCVLPMTMMLLGLGGGGFAMFGKIAAASYYVLALSTLLVAVSWWVSYRHGAVAKLKWWLAGSAAVTGLAWGVVVNEARINDYLITWM
ncbi:hypothetical protein [Cribrihabitans pelagius]|uniref:hypothetical protein n=1 Tax=Cribrihabitans pelagius TaxID=1765746 RepID=UPI003B59758B